MQCDLQQQGWCEAPALEWRQQDCAQGCAGPPAHTSTPRHTHTTHNAHVHSRAPVRHVGHNRQQVGAEAWVGRGSREALRAAGQLRGKLCDGNTAPAADGLGACTIPRHLLLLALRVLNGLQSLQHGEHAGQELSRLQRGNHVAATTQAAPIVIPGAHVPHQMQRRLQQLLLALAEGRLPSLSASACGQLLYELYRKAHGAAGRRCSAAQQGGRKPHVHHIMHACMAVAITPTLPIREMQMDKADGTLPRRGSAAFCHLRHVLRLCAQDLQQHALGEGGLLHDRAAVASLGPNSLEQVRQPVVDHAYVIDQEAHIIVMIALQACQRRDSRVGRQRRCHQGSGTHSKRPAYFLPVAVVMTQQGCHQLRPLFAS